MTQTNQNTKAASNGTLQDSDNLVVHRGSSNYKISGAKLKESIGGSTLPLILALS